MSSLTELTETQKASELDKCIESFPYFLRYCKIIQPPTLNDIGGVIDFKLSPHLIDFINVLLTKPLIVLIKSRQIWCSTTIAIYVLWQMYKKGSSWIFFSRGEREVIELLAKAHRTYNYLPDFLKLKLIHDPATEMVFDNHSSIRAFAATPEGSISFTASGVVCDEWDYHPYAERNFLNSKPTRDKGGQFIGMTTVDILEPSTLAKDIFKGASQYGFTPLFFPYNVIEGRDDIWYENTKRNIPERELAHLTPELYMHQNYPRSIEEAFSVPQTVSAFDTNSLSQMMGDVRNPLNEEWYKVNAPDLDRNIVKIYKPFSIGNYYIASSDTSHGVGKDNSVTVVMNVKTGEVVADIMNPLLRPEELAFHSVKLLNLYKNPKWFIEANEWGGVTITTAESLGYKNFGYQDEKREKIGFKTDGYMTSAGLKGSRIDLFGSLIPAINNRQITIYNKDGIKQFYDIIRNSSKNGRIEAMGGRHDDYPIAVGICWARKGEVVTTEWNPQVIESLHFTKRRDYARTR